MIDRPSDGMELDELREEYDWMYEFQSRMAERITGDKDVHNLVDYVGKLEAENVKLRELVRHLYVCMEHYEANGSISCETCPFDNDTQDCDFERRMAELGMEVDA